MATTTIRHSRPLSIAVIVIGLLLIIIAALGDMPINYAIGGVIAIIGTLLLVQPLVELESYEVRSKSPGGMTRGTYPVRYPGDLDIRDGGLWHVPTGRRIANLGIGAHRPDVEALEAMISESSPDDYTPPAGADQNPESMRFREPPQPDPFLGGPGWGGAPQNPGGRDAPIPHGEDPPPHRAPGEESPGPFPR